ncbi:MAG TPA: AAA family ATPase [Thermoplasmata archaeon]|jgi:cell division control protein 6|nr:AAA family ATPase [Thermoplasmata archaeon]
MALAHGPSVFKDQAKLSFDFLPDRLLHRDKQTQRLRSLFRPLVEAGVPSTAFLYGPVGTGKTHLSRRFALDLAKAAAESGKALEHAVVNCRQRMGDDSVLLAILRKFDERFPDRGFSIPEKLQTLRGQLEKRRTHLIVILDEVDALLKKSGPELVYTFTRWSEEGGRSTVSLILVSQKPDALNLLDAASTSTFRTGNAVEFPWYSRPELLDIAKYRADFAFHPGAVPDEVLSLIADVASEQGNARKVVELLLYAGLAADDEGVEEVSAEHVRGAKAEVLPTYVEERLTGLDATRRVVLLAIARKAKKKAYLTTGEAEDAYGVACEEFGEKKRGHTQFWKYLKELDALGLIDAKLSGEGVVGKTTLISVPEIPAKTLEKHLEASLRKRPPSAK